MASIRVGNVEIPVEQFGGQIPEWIREVADRPEPQVPRSAEEAARMGQPWGGGGIPVSREGYRVEPAPTTKPAPKAAPTTTINPETGLPYLTPPPASTTLPVAPGTGTVTIGEAEDYRAAAEQALKSLGIVNAEALGFLTDADVDRFALAKLDFEAITNYYANQPEVLAINPGAARGMSRESYYKKRESAEEAYSQQFSDTSTLGQVRIRARSPEVGPAPMEEDWLKETFQEGFTPEETTAMFADFKRRTGRAPTAAEINTFRTRPKQNLSGRTVEPAYQQDRGPVATTLRPRERSDVFGKRPL